MTPLLLVLLAALPAPDYERLVADAVRQARAGDAAAARANLDEAIAADPARPEAWVERGGLAFREGRYADAVSDLEAGLHLRRDEHTLTLLAASLSLSGRTDEAIAHWNALGRPTVRHIHIDGLQHTDDRVARREISVAEGEMLKATDIAESRQQLEEVGVFRSIEIRPVPVADGRVDLSVRMGDHHGFGRRWELLATAGAHAVRKRVRAEYRNAAGAGVNIGAQYRWDARHEKSFFVEWPRPFGIASYLTFDAIFGRQPYELSAPTTLRREGFGLGFRAVLAPASTVRWGMRFEDRTFDRFRTDAQDGRLLIAELGLDRRVVSRARMRLTTGVSLSHAFAMSDGESFGKWLADTRISFTNVPWEPAEAALQPIELALRLAAGDGYGMVPLDAMFTPGAASEMDFPLRAHKIRRDGVLGRTPFGPTIVAGSTEVRVRVHRHARADVGVVPFWDAVHLPATAEGGSRTLHDLGVGVRLGLRGKTLIRADFAHGLSDGKDAWTFGFGQTF